MIQQTEQHNGPSQQQAGILCFWIAQGREKLWLVHKVLLDYTLKKSVQVFTLSSWQPVGLTQALLVCVDSLALILAGPFEWWAPTANGTKNTQLLTT
jgi:hypothetical protein